jgi:hypothetical protein
LLPCHPGNGTPQQARPSEVLVDQCVVAHRFFLCWGSPDLACAQIVILSATAGGDKMPGTRAEHRFSAVPVVVDKCVLCHDNYKGVKKGRPVGALTYTVPVE